ncbi:DUF3857 domain-containing transglutaminase family protein [Pseudoduganella sp. OTU4001]|uniref:DUF3857 domain-containing transglutaminase family protein n=1 Tax=Pseudoduganella sp. OTU4001 TaxID=3043854 RepID=UPI00313D7886
MRPTLLALLLGALLHGPARANDDGTDRSITLLREAQHIVVQKDGSFVATTEHLTRLNDQRALQSSGQRSYSFNATHELLDIVEAYTEKPDGRRIAVTPEQIKLQQEPAYRGAPMFQDMQVKVVIFSDTGIGDKLYVKTRRTRKTALFEGHFADVSSPYFMPTEEFTLTYDLPQDMPLYVEADGFAARAPHSAGGRTVYRWDYTPSPNARPEAGSVAYWDYGRHLVVSTMKDYATLAKAYDSKAAPAAVVTPEISAKAQDITAGIEDERARAIAINEWVRKNIRYVAVYIGNGGVVPHSADSVLANRYGDCKDHTALMEALLRAVGIESTPVLIPANQAFRLSPVASLGVFNHAINYIPSLDLYLDSTADSVAGGFLPDNELGKQVLLTRSGVLARTPASQHNGVRNRYQVTIDADGGASFTFTRRDLGSYAEPVRYNHARWREEDRKRIIEELLKGAGMQGSGSIELGQLDGSAPEYSYSYSGKAENLTYLPGTVGITAVTGLETVIGGGLWGFAAENKRTQPFVCHRADFEEQADYRFPSGATLLAMPDDVTIDGPLLHYRARYERRDSGIRITRSLKLEKAGGPSCTVDDFNGAQADVRRIVRDLRAQFILQKKS